jgi:methylenetetrahydrofolate dehydrogenase (NADP+)/methenyltetrahydrofolate cyclohydrolase
MVTQVENVAGNKGEPLILNGRVLRDQGIIRLAKKISESGKKPTLAILQVGDLAESKAYIEQKRKFAEKIGAGFVHKQFPNDVNEESLIKEISELNHNPQINGVILQLPVPQHLDKQKIIDTIILAKDTDGLTSENKKLFEAGDSRAVIPATARGVLSLLNGYGISLSDKKVTVIGRSALVGGPIAVLAKRKGATVTVCHRGTEDIPGKCRQADVLVVAVGQPKFATKEFVSPGPGPAGGRLRARPRCRRCGNSRCWPWRRRRHVRRAPGQP